MASAALLLTIIGGGISDRLTPVPSKDGELMAKKLNQHDKNLLWEFYGYVNRLSELGEFEKYASLWREKIIPNDFITQKLDFGSRDVLVSNLLGGVFFGLGFRKG